MLTEPMRTEIAAGWANLLAKEQWSQAENVFAFEKEAAAASNRKRGVAVHNGTLAIELAARSLAKKHGCKYAIAPMLTVPMVRWALERAGLQVRQHDVTPSFLMDRLDLDAVGKDTLLVMVWTAGIITDAAVQLVDDARARGIPVLEDASHAHGAVFEDVKGRLRLAGEFGDMAAMSYFSTKVLAAGEGGVILTDDEEAAGDLERYANAGKRRGSNKVELVDAWNCRMTEMQAVVGRAFLKHATDVIDDRARLASMYMQMGLKPVQAFPALTSSWYKFTMRVKDADKFTAQLKELGGRVTQRTHGPDDAPPDGKYDGPVAQTLANGHVNLPTAWTTPVEAAKIAEAFLKVQKSVQ